jgi:Spy/CpxP family protein refolding chaperone
MKNLVLLLLLIPALAFAQPPGRPPGPPPERLEELRLSDAQRAKIDDLRDGERRRSIRLEADARIAEMDLEEAIDRGATNVDALVARVADLRGQLLASHVKMRLAVRALLSPEQRAKLRGMRPPR